MPSMPMRACLDCRRLFTPTRTSRSRCPDCQRAKDRMKNARRAGSARSDLPRKAKERDGYRCVMCGSPQNVQAHHRVPVARGGAHELDNLVTLCDRCHKNLHRSTA